MGPLVPENFLCWQKEKREGRNKFKRRGEKTNLKKERKRIERKRE
jgi:hypothetical protein